MSHCLLGEASPALWMSLMWSVLISKISGWEKQQLCHLRIAAGVCCHGYQRQGSKRSRRKTQAIICVYVCVCMWMLAHAYKRAGERGQVVILQANRHFNNWTEVVQGASNTPIPWVRWPASRGHMVRIGPGILAPVSPLLLPCHLSQPRKMLFWSSHIWQDGAGHLCFLPAFILAILLWGREIPREARRYPCEAGRYPCEVGGATPVVQMGA